MTKGVAKTGSALMGNLSAGNIVGVIETIGSASLSTLGIIAAGVMLLVVGMSALSVAFKPIQIILSAIGKVLGAALLPISMVIVTLLQPLIYLLFPFIKLMNMIFRPIRQFLMQQITGAKKEYAADPLGFILKAVAGLALGPVAIPLIIGNAIIKWITGIDLIGAFLGLFKDLKIPTVDQILGGITAALTTVGGMIFPTTEQIINAMLGVFGLTPINTPQLDPAEIVAKIVLALITAPLTIPIILASEIIKGILTALNIKPIDIKAPTASDIATAIALFTVAGPAGIAGNSIANSMGVQSALYGQKGTSNKGLLGGIAESVGLVGSGYYETPASTPYRLNSSTGMFEPGGVNSNVGLTFNVSGNIEEKTARYITEIVQREVASIWRSISRG